MKKLLLSTLTAAALLVPFATTEAKAWGNKCDATVTQMADTYDSMVAMSDYADIWEFSAMAQAMMPEVMSQFTYIRKNCEGKVSPSVASNLRTSLLDYLDVLEGYGYDTSSLRSRFGL